MSRLAIVGPGRMGLAVEAAAGERGHTIVARIGPGGLTADALAGADVAVEFTEPAAAADNLLQLAALGVPVVCGTTGWTERLAEVTRAVERAGTALVHAPNFSLGVQLFLRAARALADDLARRPEFDAWIVETHHRHKKDAPSGTARALQELLRGADASRDYPVTSVRGGEVPGTHALSVDGPGERLLLEHAARDRSIFARGAVVAAEWLAAGPRRGVYRFDEIVFGGHP